MCYFSFFLSLEFGCKITTFFPFSNSFLKKNTNLTLVRKVRNIFTKSKTLFFRYIKKKLYICKILMKRATFGTTKGIMLKIIHFETIFEPILSNVTVYADNKIYLWIL